MGINKELIKFQVRIPVELNQKLEDVIQRNQRSKNFFINEILEKHFQVEEPKTVNTETQIPAVN